MLVPSFLFSYIAKTSAAAFGVVTSITLKAHPAIPATGVTFSISTGPHLSTETFWVAMKQYLSYLAIWAAEGTYHYSTLYPTPTGGFLFSMAPFFAPNKTADETNTLLSPWYDQLSSLNISIDPVVTPGDSFFEAWEASFLLETVGNTGQLGSRLFPRENFVDEDLFNSTFEAIRENSESGYAFLGFNLAPTLEAGGNPDNSVNPAWRGANLHALSYASWNVSTPVDEIESIRSNFTNGAMQKWRDITPDSGAYLNEVCPSTPFLSNHNTSVE